MADGASPQVVQGALAGEVDRYPDLDGGFIWKYEAIGPAGYTAKEYARAIEAGLAG